MRAVYPHVKDMERTAAGKIRPGQIITWNGLVRFVVRAAVTTRYSTTHISGSFTNLATGSVDTERHELDPVPADTPVWLVLA